jgi:predicted extracellular nuclease
MKKLSISTPGRLTVLAALMAGLVVPAMAQTTTPADHVVISQIYGTGGNGNAGTTTAAKYRYDYVELFNPTTANISIAGWSVQYAATGNTSGYSVAAPLTGTIGAGKYYLVRLGSQAVLGDDVAPYDATGNATNGGTNISGTNGKVALASNSTALTGTTPTSANLVDLVGFGTANGFEGAAAASPSNNQSSIYRANQGCSDTNNNANDFSIATAVFRNSATAAVSCGGTTVPVNAAIVAACPAPFSVLAGAGGSASFSASDTDSIVTSATTATGTNAGITVTALNPSTADGGTLNGTLNVSASVAAGAYNVVLNFANDDSQTASCTVPVTVQQAPGTQYTIMQLQGSGELSPHPGVQTTEGVITLKLPAGGFYIQDRNGDGDPSTPDALYIYATNTTYNVGDKIRITGNITDYKPAAGARPYTEMTNVSNITFLESGAPITPTNITMPTDLRPYESMLVHINNDLIVNDAQSIGDRSELTLSSVRRETPSNRYRPGPELQALIAANKLDLLVLDDKYFTQQPTSPYFAADATVRVGDTASNLTGVIDYGSIGNSVYGFKFQPLSVPDVVISRTNPRPTSGNFAASNVKVASANVLNFFTTFTNGASTTAASGQTCRTGCRGADNMAEFIRQRDKIVASLNAAYGSIVYDVVPAPAATGTDAIRVAMIYKPSKVTLVGAAMSDAATINDRPPMAQTFKATNGGKFSLVVNHLKSKGSCPGSSDVGNTDSGDGQSCFNARRVQQANRLISYFIPAVKAAAGDDDVLLIGDFNAYAMEDPINLLTTTGGLVNQLERYIRPIGMPYSYVFDGQSGYLDHALASATLSSQITGAGEFHNNADEPDFIDYNLNSSSTPKNQDLYVNNAYRASDHDPVTISLNLAPSFSDIGNSLTIGRSAFGLNRATGQYTAAVTLTNKTAAALSGPFQVEISGLPSGVTLANASGLHNGVPYVTVNNASLAPGATVSVTLIANNPNKVAIGYTATIYSGNF